MTSAVEKGCLRAAFFMGAPGLRGNESPALGVEML